jgi:hypothetical protein
VPGSGPTRLGTPKAESHQSVILEQVGGYHQHTIKPMQLLHEHVALLMDVSFID